MQLKCWISGQPAVTCCRFCGRAMAEEFIQEAPYFMSIFVGKNNTPKAVGFHLAVWCGYCHVGDPFEIPLDEEQE